MIQKIITIGAFILFLLSPISVSAHVVVKPSEVKPSSFERFAVGVPVEKEIPTTAVRLLIPEGLNYVSPYVKTGWNIEIKKDASENPKVTEIIWTGGIIPVGQKDEFIFSAQVPANETNIKWKAYQTYSDESVVSWDMEPSTSPKSDDDKSTPFSVTKVSSEITLKEIKPVNQNEILLYLVSGLSLIVSITTGILVGTKLKRKD